MLQSLPQYNARQKKKHNDNLHQYKNLKTRHPGTEQILNSLSTSLVVPWMILGMLFQTDIVPRIPRLLMILKIL